LNKLDNMKGVMEMVGVKHCPKCGSSNVNFLSFYRPSIWKCLDCGYEGAFIIEDSVLAEKIQKRDLQVIASYEEIRTAVNEELKELDIDASECQEPSPPCRT
jgi:DNA-directed RNA polymerase subunit M